jgi:hypothetical protein
LAEATTGKARNFARSYQYPMGWPTPFEIVAEEAIRRARILLDAAAGRIRPERLRYEEERGVGRQQMQDFDKAAAELELKFDRLARGRAFLPILETLEAALPAVHRRKPENPFRYWREYLRDDIVARRQQRNLPSVPVLFSDEATADERGRAVEDESPEGPPSCIVLTHSRSYQVTRTEFPRLILGLAAFYRSKGKNVQKQWAESAGRKGGKKVQAHQRPGKLSKLDSLQLTKAAKKVQRRRPGD